VSVVIGHAFFARWRCDVFGDNFLFSSFIHKLLTSKIYCLAIEIIYLNTSILCYNNFVLTDDFKEAAEGRKCRSMSNVKGILLQTDGPQF